MPDEVRAFLRCEEPDRGPHEGDDLVEVARPRGPEERLQFRKRELDGIEVRTVGREKSHERTGLLDRRLDRELLMDREVIEHHDIAGPESGHQHLLDVGEECGVIDRAVEDGGRVQAIPTQGGDHRVGLPVAARCVITEPEAARAAAVAAEQVGGDAGFVEKDVVPGIAQRLEVLPAAPCGRDVSAPLFVGVDRFF